MPAHQGRESKEREALVNYAVRQYVIFRRTYADIGRELGVADTSVRDWMVKLNLNALHGPGRQSEDRRPRCKRCGIVLEETAHTAAPDGEVLHEADDPATTDTCWMCKIEEGAADRPDSRTEVCP